MAPKKGAGKKSSEKEYSVEKVVNKRTANRGVEYLIKWRGYPSSENTWEPATHLNCKDLVEEYEKRNAPQPPKAFTRPRSAKRGRPASQKPSTLVASAPAPRGDKNALKKIESVQKQHGSLIFICEMGDGSKKRFSRAEAFSRWPSQVFKCCEEAILRLLE
ncbi:hypothetical protein GCK72_012586 [Caenorhabditis remanei]|uniref:Chromo domain-containing protein n=1 Tax=Caenorhabditis remanei TaxID=31234 RepID=A0A6A5GNF2_CAERE|nr:hypothetical protein GCK72_012586 [Caenorhabditis remanei]KAF1756133.1 hypothetical protein GCK72_012586 [Caenorhabditis remanei]